MYYSSTITASRAAAQQPPASSGSPDLIIHIQYLLVHVLLLLHFLSLYRIQNCFIILRHQAVRSVQGGCSGGSLYLCQFGSFLTKIT